MCMGDKLRELRAGLELSVGEAARALGVTTVRYSSVENNKGEALTALELAEVMLRRSSAAKHHPELTRSVAELEAALGRADACVLRRGATTEEKNYGRGVSDVLAWLLGCPGDRAFLMEAMR